MSGRGLKHDLGQCLGNALRSWWSPRPNMLSLAKKSARAPDRPDLSPAAPLVFDADPPPGRADDAYGSSNRSNRGAPRYHFGRRLTFGVEDRELARIVGPAFRADEDRLARHSRWGPNRARRCRDGRPNRTTAANAGSRRIGDLTAAIRANNQRHSPSLIVNGG